MITQTIYLEGCTEKFGSRPFWCTFILDRNQQLERTEMSTSCLWLMVGVVEQVIS